MTDRHIAPKPPLTVEDIEREIAHTHYYTPVRSIYGPLTTADVPPAVARITHCAATLRSGFVVVGTAYCGPSTPYDPWIGQQAAREDVIRQLWPIVQAIRMQGPNT